MTTVRLSSASRRQGRCDGFTLIEVLASFVVLALLTLAIQRGVVAAATGTARADAYAGAEAVAATLLDGPLTGAGGVPSPGSGNLNGYDWTLRVEPLPPARFGAGASPPDAAPAWTPVRVAVEVRQGGSREVIASAETVRLVPAGP